MENKRIEASAKNILSNSKLTIANPDFNGILMSKIKRENRKNILLKNLKYYFIIFVGIDILIITLLSLFNVGISDVFVDVDRMFELNSKQLISIYFIFLITVIVLIKSIFEDEYYIGKIHQTNVGS
jgi:hypothetical protein